MSQLKTGSSALDGLRLNFASAAVRSCVQRSRCCGFDLFFYPPGSSPVVTPYIRAEYSLEKSFDPDVASGLRILATVGVTYEINREIR